MGKHLFQRAFRDLLSLHGYPLPFESIEPIVGGAAAPPSSRGRHRECSASSREVRELRARRAPR